MTITLNAVSTNSTLQHVIDCPFQNDEDWLQVRDLLIATYPIMPVGFNWDIRRWDGWRYHRLNPTLDEQRKRLIHLWRTEQNQLVGVAHFESPGDVFLELDPDYRHIEPDMLAWAEANLAASADNQRELRTFVFDYAIQRRLLLAQRGYEETREYGVLRRLRLGNWRLPEGQIAEGYTLRTTTPGDESDYQRVADILNAGFNRTVHTAQEVRNFMTLAPCFRADLDLVAEAPDGSFASYVGVTYDEINRNGIFEPVCTHPDHRRKGLAQALMFEGLHRLKALGAADVTVETGDATPANALYDSVGFTELYTGHVWRKVFQETVGLTNRA